MQFTKRLNDINPNELIKNIINEQMKFYIDEIIQLKSNELINNKLEENNKEVISLKKN